MLVVDAQVHIWSQGTPSANHRQVPSFTADQLLAEMDEAGVDAALIHPPTSWDPSANEVAMAAAQAHPRRFGILGNFPLNDPANRGKVVPDWRQKPGMLGFRFSLTGQGQSSWLTDGTMDWFWDEAEEHNVPVALLAGRNLPKFAEIAAAHPGLKLLIDHLGSPPLERGTSIWSQVPALVELAKYPNVAMKATGAPSYSAEDYPYRDIHTNLREVFDAYGPHRFFWGTDITRMPCGYRQCVTLFTEELPWLSGADLDLVMGRAVADWVGWDLPLKD